MGEGVRRIRSSRWLLTAAFLLAAGCQQMRLPAIDPTGERIFSPSGTTQWAVPSDSRTPSSSIWPRPAWEQPLTPPPCPEPTLGPPIGIAAAPQTPLPADRTGSSGIPGTLRITPTRMIAPVGSEVVLLGGLCGDDGFLVTNQPIEWMLSQDSVGQFIEINDHGILWNRSKKLSSNYAITRTSSRGEIQTRGTPSVTDDIIQQKGQCWVSLTSASEGTSYVTAVASRGAVWPQRRQTATIYWVDAQWAFPPPAAVSAGQAHTLTTSITRTATNAPVVGYIVRYEVIDGSPAGFGPERATAAEVATDAQGIAAAALTPASPSPGVTQVRIEIIRPADPAGDAPRTKLGEGYTSITWSAPGLALRAAGPSDATLGATLSYRVEIHNPGDIPTRDVVVSSTLPPTLKFVGSVPPAQLFGDRAEWRLGDLPARSMQVLDIQVQADAGGGIRYTFTAAAADGLRADAFVDTQIARPSLALNVSGPSTASVGDRVQFRIEVTNTSDQPLRSVRVTDRFDSTLEHAEGLASPIQRVIDQLPPGATEQIAVGFFVRRAGQVCHVIEADAAGTDRVVREICLTVSTPAAAPQPSLRVTKTGSTESRVGQSVPFSTVVTNTGNVPLTNVRISESFDPALEPRESTPGWEAAALAAGQLVWIIDRLQPGESTQRDVLCVCREPAAAAVAQVRVTADEGTNETAQATVRILPAAAAAPPPGGTPSTQPPPAAGQLTLEVLEFGDPVGLGKRASYAITIRNDRSAPDQDVVVTVEFPPGLRFEKLDGPERGRNVSADGRTVRVSPIREVRAGEKLPEFRVEVTGVQVGEHSLRVTVTSRLAPQGVSSEVTTTVLPD